MLELHIQDLREPEDKCPSRRLSLYTLCCTYLITAPFALLYALNMKCRTLTKGVVYYCSGSVNPKPKTAEWTVLTVNCLSIIFHMLSLQTCLTAKIKVE